MPNYNSTLQSNNSILQAILAAINALPDASGATMISFSIDGTTYQAEEGMTWGEWADSEYNTIGCYFDEHGLYFPASETRVYVEPTDVI
jgi:hypothetical protein